MGARMEPTIYNPGAYKTPGVYNGAGGVYNGRGVYNDGAIYNGPFVLLNNCDNIDGENVCKSVVGPDLFVNDNLSFGDLVDSNIFTGSKSIKRTNSNYVRLRDINVDDVFTIEFYISDIANNNSNGTDIYSFSVFSVSSRTSDIVVGGPNLYDFDTSYPVITWIPGYEAIQINYVQNAHFAAVINKNEKKVYCFVNGAKIGSYKYTNLGTQIAQNGNIANAIIEFFCVRNGDFSNNLNSFDVPTQKYHL